MFTPVHPRPHWWPWCLPFSSYAAGWNPDSPDPNPPLIRPQPAFTPRWTTGPVKQGKTLPETKGVQHTPTSLSFNIQTQGARFVIFKSLGLVGSIPWRKCCWTYWDQHFSCWKFSGDVWRSVRLSSVPPLDGPSSCTTSRTSRTSSDSQPKSPSDARLLGGSKTICTLYKSISRLRSASFQGWDPHSPAWFVGGPIGRPWKMPLIFCPKLRGGVAEIITAWSPDARHEKNHGTSQPELYMAIKLFDWRFQPVCSLEIEGPELQDMAPGNKFFLQFLVHWGVFAHSNCGNTTLFVSQKQLQ